MSEYFPKRPSNYKNIKVKIDLANYATKKDIDDITHVHTSNFALKTNLADLKTKVDKLDIDKLVPVPLDLSKLSNAVKNDAVKKTVYDKLVVKVNNIDTSRFVLKNEYDTDKTELKNKIPDTRCLVKKTDYNARITATEFQIPSISGLATNAALTAVEIKIPNISSLLKKTTDYYTKNIEIEKKLTDHNYGKYVTTPEFNTLAANVFYKRLAQANLITKTDFDIKLSSLNRKSAAKKSKHLLVENELKKLKKFYSIYFRGKSNFEEDGMQSYLVFQSMYRGFKRVGGVVSGIFVFGDLRWKN